MGVVKIVDLRIKEWKGQHKLIKMIPIFFLMIIIPLCTNRSKKYIAYQLYSFTYGTKHDQHDTINWQHEKISFCIRIDIKIVLEICMDTWHLHQGTRMQNKK
jgi:hypothetical protein